MTNDTLDPGAMQTWAQRHQKSASQAGRHVEGKPGKLSFDMNRIEQQVFSGSLPYKQLHEIRGEIDAALQEVERELGEEESKLGRTTSAQPIADGNAGVEAGEKAARIDTKSEDDRDTQPEGENDAAAGGVEVEGTAAAEVTGGAGNANGGRLGDVPMDEQDGNNGVNAAPRVAANE